MNYAEKRKEFDQHNPAPTLFVRFPDSQTAHNAPVLKPRHSSEFDYEGELAVIIGKGGENIRREEARATLPATAATWMAPRATGSTAGLPRGKTGGRPAHSARGWRPRMRSRIRIS